MMMSEIKKKKITTRKKKVVEKKYVLDYNKVKTVKDIIVVIKSFNPTYRWTGDTPPAFEEIFNKNLLIEINK